MGAEQQKTYTQYPPKFGDGLRAAAIGQTRVGVDELIAPVAMWELDDASGLYMPPGLSVKPRVPRVGLGASVDTLDVGSARKSVAIAPDDDTDLAAATRGIYVGTGGDLKVDLLDDDDETRTTVTYKNIAGGFTHSKRVIRVYATGTTATDLIAEY